MIKFRTMINKSDLDGNLLSDSERLTNFGKFLRSSSLDELPSFWNVIKGNMSLVGPRPLLVEYLPLYNSKQRRRHEVKPGISGWAQINGRNAITWDQKFDFDIWYVDNNSIWLDIKILLLTVKKVFIQDGINQSKHVIMPKFKGSHNAK
jgi:lipopolysaccharide/colanic/teichoic acid biosynthesis glycosyltransferase